MKRANIPFFIPHRGCPFQCAFCDQKKISGETAHLCAEDVRRKVKKALSTLNDRRAEIAFFGGSFTGIPSEEQEELLSAAYEFKESGEVDGIRLSTRPDYIDESVLARLSRFGVTAVELGAQSMDDAVLRASGRGHTAEDVRRASRMIREHGFSLGLQMMTGLPGATYESDMNSAREIAVLCPDTVRIYPTLVLSGTPLCEWYQRGEYQPQDLDEAVERAADIKELFLKEGAQVLRLGLHSEERLEKSLVAGPYHPAFGELVASRIFYHRMEHFIKKERPTELIIGTPKERYSRVVGQKKENIKKIEKDLKIPCRVEQTEDSFLTLNGIIIEI